MVEVGHHMNEKVISCWNVAMVWFEECPTNIRYVQSKYVNTHILSTHAVLPLEYAFSHKPMLSLH